MYGRPIRIKTEEDIYYSYISAISLNDENFVCFKSGSLRNTLLDKLKKDNNALQRQSVVNSLNSISETDALSANQGRILANDINDLEPLCIYMQTHNGVLVSLPDAGLWKMMTFNIIGNGYTLSNPISSHIQGYHFQSLGNLIHCKQHNTSGNLPICKFLIKDNKIALWIPSIGSYTSLIITCFQTHPQVAQLPLTYEFMDTEPDATYKVTCTLTNNIIYDTDIETGKTVNGKKEYLRTCTIGAIANTKSASFAKATGITPKNILKIEGTVFSSDAGASWGLPNQNLECHISSPNIWVTNNTGFNITSGLIYIYFTK